MTLHDIGKGKKQLFRRCFSNLGDGWRVSKLGVLQSIRELIEVACGYEYLATFQMAIDNIKVSREPCRPIITDGRRAEQRSTTLERRTLHIAAFVCSE